MNESNLVPIYGEWIRANYEVQSPMTFFWHMDGSNHHSGISIPRNLRTNQNIARSSYAKPVHGAYTAHLTTNDNTTQKDYFEVQKIIQMFQILDLINFSTFFQSWYFKGSDTTMDTNMRFKMLLQAVGLEITFDMEKDSFLFETTTIFVVAQEVHSGVFTGS